jgi:hypothetical protein
MLLLCLNSCWHAGTPKATDLQLVTAAVRMGMRVPSAATRAALYDSGRVADGMIDLNFRPGKYVMILSNRGSLAFSRLVNADFSLRYVK